MKRQGGFTLIELVVVIVILGILAVTAAPRFLNLQDDARDSALDGLKGAMAGAAGITYGKAAVNGQESTADGAISVGSSTLNLDFGYPEPTATALALVVDGLTTDDWEAKKVTPAAGGNPGKITYGFKNYEDKCVEYTGAKDKDTPAVVKVIKNTTANKECEK
ncbi:MSHA pilin protein MshA [Vibrio harveyi]|uniref:type II secretion system protein n=1 Tax=Vibrio harveyi TaxID=669 RepID=UPI001EFCC882|nr:type II secretion system protein [Vibrio harveyi]MCG9236299.1 type II secretion system GspH family protein [Vibrio harveyi]MCG9584817.1 type II secretion system GspH family protein [Vibrio harveyi]CAH1218180.1 MSHA pilin protein MshA [Vibrio harveyi]CAH1552708.1 MSHA pilin protein MshA [Vibrio harveyi]CAH1559035.1 MSHA pilin protein MshA [Vibrio harveyi]